MKSADKPKSDNETAKSNHLNKKFLEDLRSQMNEADDKSVFAFKRNKDQATM